MVTQSIHAPNEVIESIQEEGFTVIQDPAKAKVDIVFVHGVLGKQPCWTSESGIFWPQKLLAPKLPDARILSYRYTEKIRFSEGKTDASVACLVYGRLIDDLAEHRKEKASKNRPILFVAHCLGGVILEGSIVHAWDDNSQKELVSCIRGILLLGTPHFKEGSELAAKKYFEYAMESNSAKPPEDLQELISISQNFFDLKQKNEANFEIKSFRASIGNAVNEALAQWSNALKPQLLGRGQLQLSQFADESETDFKQVLRTLTRWWERIVQESSENDEQEHDEPRVDFSGSSYNSGMQIGSNRSQISGLTFNTTNKV
ncbi:hypothetical protein FP744_10006886 [Trichoderma asperellum]|nr:hypothetical protein LI328DRAFT_162424 [Trichoderma asperelloides]